MLIVTKSSLSLSKIDRMGCTPQEKFMTEVGAGAVQVGSFATAVAVTGAGFGSTTPLGYGILASGNIAAEGIRAYCSTNPFGDITLKTAKEAGSTGVSIAASAIAPGSGMATRLVTTGAALAYDAVVGDLPKVHAMNGVSDNTIPSISIISSAEAAVPVQPLDEPIKLLPDKLPELTSEAKAALRAQSAEARKSVVAANHTGEAHDKGHGLAAGKAPPSVENGLY